MIVLNIPTFLVVIGVAFVAGLCLGLYKRFKDKKKQNENEKSM